MEMKEAEFKVISPDNKLKNYWTVILKVDEKEYKRHSFKKMICDYRHIDEYSYIIIILLFLPFAPLYFYNFWTNRSISVMKKSCMREYKKVRKKEKKQSKKEKMAKAYSEKFYIEA